ncbi:hypothetical protein KBD20_01940 [Candidatus Saccharibacteria bacterium]|nr:hypothetical protein [Candidatus Saccharibacteria bacterium]
MIQIETEHLGRRRTEWNTSDLDAIQQLAIGLHEATSDSHRVDHFTDGELDTLFPVDLDAPNAKPAHEIWADLKSTYYDYDTWTTPTEQLVSVFALASDTLIPNRMSTEQRAQKNAQCMRAFQSGIQKHYTDLGYATTARDRSELDTSFMLHKSKSLLTGHAKTEYTLAIEAAGLQSTPVKRIHRAAFRVAHILRTARI